MKNSTTVKDLGETSLVSYVTSWAELRWYSDQLSLGNGAKLETFNFGVSIYTAQRRPSSMGILGLRSDRRNNSVTEPPLLLDQMVDSGLVNIHIQADDWTLGAQLITLYRSSCN